MDNVTEHEMGAGEIAVTVEFMTKLLQSVSEQSPDSAKIELLIKALTDAVQEDRSLDVQDIPAVMDHMLNAAGAEGDAESLNESFFMAAIPVIGVTNRAPIIDEDDSDNDDLLIQNLRRRSGL